MANINVYFKAKKYFLVCEAVWEQTTYLNFNNPLMLLLLGLFLLWL